MCIQGIPRKETLYANREDIQVTIEAAKDTSIRLSGRFNVKTLEIMTKIRLDSHAFRFPSDGSTNASRIKELRMFQV